MTISADYGKDLAVCNDQIRWTTQTVGISPEYTRDDIDRLYARDSLAYKTLSELLVRRATLEGKISVLMKAQVAKK